MQKTLPIIDIKKYGGKQVAIFQGKIIASGATSTEAIKKAKEKISQATWRDILLVSVPKGLTILA